MRNDLNIELKLTHPLLNLTSEANLKDAMDESILRDLWKRWCGVEGVVTFSEHLQDAPNGEPPNWGYKPEFVEPIRRVMLLGKKCGMDRLIYWQPSSPCRDSTFSGQLRDIVLKARAFNANGVYFDGCQIGTEEETLWVLHRLIHGFGYKIGVHASWTPYPERGDGYIALVKAPFQALFDYQLRGEWPSNPAHPARKQPIPQDSDDPAWVWYRPQYGQPFGTCRCMYKAPRGSFWSQSREGGSTKPNEEIEAIFPVAEEVEASHNTSLWQGTGRYMKLMAEYNIRMGIDTVPE